VTFLLDTGATFVSIDSRLAKRLRIKYRFKKQQVRVETAAGPIAAYRVKLKSVAVGNIRLKNVDALVSEEKGLTMPLLGMSFLSRLRVQQEGIAMVLETKP
jgi:aspartyl protease family protein